MFVNFEKCEYSVYFRDSLSLKVKNILRFV